jgi:phosphatidylglycerol:prolipoprotein diacylglycerol transferase
LPGYINSVALSVGFLSIKWYAISYLVGFFVICILLRFRAGECIKDAKIFNFHPPAGGFNQIPNPKSQILKFIDDFLIYAIVGLLIGARLGYVFFYNFSYFWENPILIISPYDFNSGIYTGISGMSYFGGLIGIFLATLIFVRKNKLDFWQWADFVIPAVPAGYFFGRIGNFLNGELYGRATAKFWGMYFPGGGEILRHPSQIYEAFFEGIILFVILWTLRDRSKFPSYLFCFYLFGYGLFRILIEFFREPDAQSDLYLGFLTLGQIFSLGLIISSAILFFWQRNRKMIL